MRFLDFINASILQLLRSRILLKIKVDDVQFTGSTWIEMMLQPPTAAASASGLRPTFPCPTRILAPLLWEAHISLSSSSEVDIQPIGTRGGVRASLPWSLHHSKTHTLGPIPLPAGWDRALYPSWRCTHSVNKTFLRLHPHAALVFSY